MFDDVKNMYQVQKKAKKIKKELKNTHIEAEEDGFVVTINGEQEVVNVKIPENGLNDQQRAGEKLMKAFNKGIKKSQEIAADMMKDVMGGMNFPGLS